MLQHQGDTIDNQSCGYNKAEPRMSNSHYCSRAFVISIEHNNWIQVLYDGMLYFVNNQKDSEDFKLFYSFGIKGCLISSNGQQ